MSLLAGSSRVLDTRVVPAEGLEASKPDAVKSDPGLVVGEDNLASAHQAGKL